MISRLHFFLPPHEPERRAPLSLRREVNPRFRGSKREILFRGILSPVLLLMEERECPSPHPFPSTSRMKTAGVIGCGLCPEFFNTSKWASSVTIHFASAATAQSANLSSSGSVAIRRQ